MAKKAKKPVAKVSKITKTSRSGADLGRHAQELKVKTVTTILALADVVGIAYSAYYHPWAKVGKPGKKVPEKAQADKHWADFLRESGYLFPRHHKLVRSLWMIHKKMDILKPNSENLPNSIDAIKKIASVKLTDKQQKVLMKSLSESHTAKDVSVIIGKVKTGSDYSLQELDDAGADEMLSRHDAPKLPKQSSISMASDLIAHETIISSANRHLEQTHNGFLLVLCRVDAHRKQTVEIDVLSEPDLVDEAIKLAHEKLTSTKQVKAA